MEVAKAEVLAQTVTASPPDLPDTGSLGRTIAECLWLVHAWWIDSDFQTKLLVVLLSCLMLNLILIRAAWRVYGECLTEMLTKDSMGRDLSDDGPRYKTEDLLNNKIPKWEKMHRE